MKKILLLSLTLLLLLPQTLKADDVIDPSPLYLYSSNYVLIDQDSSEILLSKNSKDKVRPASITKALTLITALEMLDKTPLSTQYSAPKEAFDGLSTIASIADFQEGDLLSLDDYLYGIMLPSGADATRIISMYLTNEPEGLIEEMNILAKKIGMNDSNFVNTSGLDEDNHYASVEDLAKMIQYSLKNEDFRRYYTAVTHTTAPTAKYPEGIDFENYYLAGALERDFKLLYGAKSGYTELAERALSSVASNGNMNLIFVSTNAPREEKLDTNLEDAINVYKLAFDAYEKIPLKSKGDVITNLAIDKRARAYPIIANQDLAHFMVKDTTTSDAITTLFEPSDNLKAPISKDTVLGTLSYLKGDTLIHSEIITAQEDISMSFRYHLLIWVQYIGIALLVLIILALILILAIRQYRLNVIRKKRKAMGWVRRSR